eukprot:gene9302-9383_t
MSGTIEHAQEGLEHAHHAAEHGTPHKFSRDVAILIAVLAACLALSEMGEKAAQNSYLTHHISVSDTYNFMQAKNLRRATYSSNADVIDSVPGVDPDGRKRAERLRSEAARMADEPSTGDGAKQLLQKAHDLEHERDHAFHVSPSCWHRSRS